VIANAWLPFHKHTDTARVRLFCLPHAGGTAAGYRSLARLVPPHIEVCPVELPGRATRRDDPLARRLVPLARQFADVIGGITDLPFAIFGHSMGGLIAFEVARALRERGLPPPLGLLISATAPPAEDPYRGSHLLSDDELLQEVVDQGGAPEEVSSCRELFRMALPRLRADLEACETYRYVNEVPLQVPITFFAGRDDKTCSEEVARGWAAQSVQPLRVRILDGDHFYQQEALPELAREIIADVDRWSATSSVRRADGLATIFGRFAEVVRQQADRPAVVDTTRSLTYAQTLDGAERVAVALRECGQDDRLVIVRHGRNRHLVTSLLGVLASGRGYVSVDPGCPQPRRDQIYEGCGSRLVVTDGPLEPSESPLARIGDITVAIRPGSDARTALPDDVAYVIYTSGTTGVPKGCMVGNAHVLAFLDAWKELVKAGPEDVWTQFHSISADLSVLELWGSLLSGGTCVVVPSKSAADPAAFADLLTDQRVTVLNLTQTVFGNLRMELMSSGRKLPDLRHLSVGAETMRPHDIAAWFAERLAPNAEVLNSYGPTETTVTVTGIVLTEDMIPHIDPDHTPIGRPLSHVTLSIRDDAGRTVPDGVPGELWITGDSVAHGYLGAPELTADRFVTAEGRRHYRSGDFVVSPDGDTIQFVGRHDGQVKIRGYRIELGEIEAALAGVPGIRAAAAGAETTRRGHQRLAAYAVTDPASSIDAGDIREHLSSVLPAQCQPQLIKRIGALPITINGKLDRRALAALPTLSW
jgi:amino acid adenylation domain-containing protein